MREIKFRAWEYGHSRTSGFDWKSSALVWKINYNPKISGGETFYEGDYVNLNSALANGGEADYEIVNKSIFMQYTGLHDKNGVEIYEGDVVRILYTDWLSQLDSSPELSHEEYLDSISSVKVVIWSVQGFYVSESVDGYASSMEHGAHGRITVIGNIYENPELLEVTL